MSSIAGLKIYEDLTGDLIIIRLPIIDRVLSRRLVGTLQQPTPVGPSRSTDNASNRECHHTGTPIVFISAAGDVILHQLQSRRRELGAHSHPVRWQCRPVHEEDQQSAAKHAGQIRPSAASELVSPHCTEI